MGELSWGRRERALHRLATRGALLRRACWGALIIACCGGDCMGAPSWASSDFSVSAQRPKKSARVGWERPSWASTDCAPLKKATSESGRSSGSHSPRRSIFVRQHKLFGGKKIIWREKGFLPPLTRKYPTRVY